MLGVSGDTTIWVAAVEVKGRAPLRRTKGVLARRTAEARARRLETRIAMVVVAIVAIVTISISRRGGVEGEVQV